MHTNTFTHKNWARQFVGERYLCSQNSQKKKIKSQNTRTFWSKITTFMKIKIKMQRYLGMANVRPEKEILKRFERRKKKVSVKKRETSARQQKGRIKMYNLFCVKPSVQFVKWKCAAGFSKSLVYFPNVTFFLPVSFLFALRIRFTWNMILWDKRPNAVKTEWMNCERRRHINETAKRFYSQTRKMKRKRERETVMKKCAMNMSMIKSAHAF